MAFLNSSSKDEIEIQLRKRISELEKANRDLCAQIVVLNRDITEWKSTEEKRKKDLETLRYSEDQFRVLLQNVKSGVALIDEIGRFAVVNPTLMQMFGLNSELNILNINSQDWSQWEVYGENGKLLHVDDHPVRKAVKTGKPVKDQLVAVRNPGSKELTWMLISAEPILNEEGHIYKIICTYHDITKQKKAEEALKKAHQNLEKKVKERTAELEKTYHSLKESEKRLAEAQEMAHIGHWEWTIATDKSYWSDELYRIFGRDPYKPYPTYQEFLNYVHPDDRDHVNNAVNRAMNGKTYSIDYRIIRTNGEERTVQMKSQIIFGENKIPIQIKGIVQDITESKRTEENLRLSEERYRSFVQNFRGITFQIDQNFKLEFIHGATKEITGYNEEELFLYTSWRQLVMPEDLDMFLEAEQKAALSSGDYHAEIEYRIRTKDGKIKWMNEFHQKISAKNGSPEKYIGVIYDATEKKEIEKALEKIDTARQKEIHHRIKNNLQVISSLLELQADKFRNRENIKDLEVLEAFRESQDRVASIALIHEELHECEKTDSLNMSLYLERLAENLINTYSIKVDVSLKTDFRENIFFDMDIAVPLGMIVNELVSNSLKYAFLGRGKGEIEIKLFENKPDDKEGQLLGNSTKYTLIVSDNGCGIPENIDFKNSSTLGLQLVTILVDQLDGEIKLKRDRGTEFIICFGAEEKGN